MQRAEKAIYLFMILFGSLTFLQVATQAGEDHTFISAVLWSLVQIGAVVIAFLGLAAAYYEQNKDN